MARISIDNITKRYGTTPAVENFSLVVGDGEIVALLGPSGCGKTTTMRIIAGITAPDHGQIEIDGQRIDHLPPEKRNIGLVFQSYALFPHMTVESNVGFGLRMRGLASDEIARKVGDALALVDLAALGRRYPRQLSGGQQQRVALARALVTEPRVLLLDEPLSNLDARLREQLREDLRTLQRRLGTTAIYVTHDQAEALALADRVILMNQGRIVEEGTPHDLYRTPRHRFTAEFLGHTNLFPGHVEDGLVKSPWGAPIGPASAGQNRMLISVRPEDILLQAGGGPGRVCEVTFLGADVEHKIEVAGLTMRTRSSGKDASILPVGTAVSITLPAHVHMIAG